MTIFGVGISIMGEPVGVIAFVVGPVVIWVGLWMRANKIWEPPVAPQPVIEKHIIEEVIKVRCKYCGTLNGVKDKACSACGGTL